MTASNKATIENISEIPRELVQAEMCRKKFFKFVQEFWDVIIDEEPVWNWHIEYLCNELQAMAERVKDRKPKLYDLIINIPPGSTKSTICSIMFQAWSWTIDPSMRHICSSYADTLSMDLAVRCRDIITSDKYQMFFPEINLRRDTGEKRHFKNTKNGERLSTSTGGAITGSHAHIIVVDDPINPKEAVSDIMLKTANDYLDTTLSQRKVDKAITPTILIMQRLHQNDCTGHLLDKNKDKTKHVCLPAEQSIKIKPEHLEQYYEAGLLDPIRLSKDVCKEARIDLGSYGYAGQFEQSPSPREGGFFQRDWFKTIDNFDKSKIVTSVRYWDKAGTQGGGKRTAGVLMHRLKNNDFIISHIVKGQWSAKNREDIIEKYAEIDGSTYGTPKIPVKIWVEQEPGSGGKESAENTIANLAGYSIHVEKVSDSKEARAEPLSAQAEAGNIYVLKKEWTNDFLDEIDIFPNGKFKDQADAASGAFNKIIAKPKGRVGTWGKRNR